MKTLFLTVLLCCCSFFAVKAQGIASCTPNAAVTGQVLTVSIVGSNNNFFTVTTTFLRQGGYTIYPAQWQRVNNSLVTATYNIHPNAPLGAYDVIVGTTFAQSLAGGFTVGTGVPVGNYGQLYGYIFKDDNNNCFVNGIDPRWGNKSVTVDPGGYGALADNNGYYRIWLPLGNYSVSHTPLLPDTVECGISGPQPFSITTNGQVVAKDFPTSGIVFSDAQVAVTGQRLRMGMTSNMAVMASNSGSAAVTSGVVKYLKPSFATLTAASPWPNTISGDTLMWNFTNLSSTPIVYNFTCFTPGNIMFGTDYVNKAWILPNPIDYWPGNNQFIDSLEVAGSCDPNDKHVYTGSGMPADGDIAPTESLLRYVVRFQNTGNDTAFNIFVRDTLDVAHLDLGTFRVLGSSHAHSVTMSPNGQVEFFFPNILLPDSGRNQLASNGMFQFQIGIKPGMPLGTVIPNSVSIYFDNNAPVKTNTTQTRLCDVLQSAAGFSANGLSVQFNNQTTGAVNSRLWDFGDGSTSTLLHPNHTYAAPGTCNVCLISNGACRSDTQCLSINVCTSPPTSGFNPSFTGLTAAFNNTSLNAVSYEWDFGDGGTATVATPTHAYLAIGNYNVCLVTTSSCGDKDTLCSTITVCTNPIANMSLANGGNGNLSFTDHSQHTVSWSWDFGDGGTSSLQNPTHQYQNDGNYTICLIVQSSCGADTVCNIVSVCGIPVVAAFSESIVGLNVNFSGNSTNTSTYSWDFGDGSPVVTGANPSHSYAAIGNYLVCMNSASACGTVDSICRLITVCIPPVAGFNPVNAGAGNFNFVDFSTHANSWFWDFGNGDTSHQQSPSYQFVSNGVYTVCLTTTNLCGLDSTCTTMAICPETLEAAFSANGNQFTYNFTDLSQGGLQYFWDFGDGFTSNATSPSHTYASNGIYNVCLQVTNLCGDVDSTCQTQTVSVVGVHSPIAGFEIHVMPNPMDRQTLVQVQHPNAFGEYQFHLYDSKGALVRSQIGVFNKALSVPRENLSDGLYFYRIHQQGTELGNGRILMRGE